MFRSAWALPTATARLWFALEYARLDRWLTRRNLALLSISPLVGLLLIFTNQTHHLVWQSILFKGSLAPQIGIGGQIMVGYGYLTVLAVLAIFIWRFFRSPQDRWPVALVLCGQFIANVLYLFPIARTNPIAPLEPTFLGNILSSIMYALALFGFRMFDPILIARKTVIEQMHEGMLVLDSRWRIVDLNPAAVCTLALPVARLRGRDVVEILPDCARLMTGLDDMNTAQSETSLGAGDDVRLYMLRISPLKDQQDHVLGYLLLMSDISEQKRAQAKILEQQRALATASERERLARELHDSIGQVLGYAGFQVEAVRKRIADGQAAVAANQFLLAGEQMTTADSQLARLGSIVQEAHADVRAYILNLRLAPSEQLPFFAALQHYLDGFSRNYGIRTDLAVGEGLDDNTFEQDAQMQLFRIAQEALSNARKHAGARCVRVTFEVKDRLARMIVQDGGRGFDPAQAAVGAGNHFGLEFMRQRAEELGGHLWLQSAPAEGTRVVVEVPLRERVP
jgi:signal transduction histidine kinase